MQANFLLWLSPYMKYRAQRVANLYLKQAGLFSAPPAMVRDITEWVQAIAANDLVRDLRLDLKRLHSPSEVNTLDFVGRLREEFDNGSLRSLSVWAERVKSQAPKIKGAPTSKDFKLLTRADLVERLDLWANRVETWARNPGLDKASIRAVETQIQQLTPYLRNIPKDTTKAFPIDLTGWKYGQGVPPGWSGITVSIVPSTGHSGWWTPSKRELVVALVYPLTVDLIIHAIPTIVQHEMLHVTQDILESLGRGKGLPSRSIQTPQHRQTGRLWDDKNHDLDDAEFYPMLDTEIRFIRRGILDTWTPAQVRQYVLWAVGIGERPEGAPKSRSKTLALWKQHAPAKWRKAVKLIYSAFDL